MTDNPHHLELLIAYADGVADEQQRAEAQKLVASDASAAEFLASLTATRLPYREAYDQVLIDAPSAVQNAVLSSSADGSQDASDDRTSKRAHRWRPALAMAACLLGGVIIGALVSGKSFTGSGSVQSVGAPRWVQLIADYHSMYVRDTLTDAAAQTPAQVESAMAAILGGELQIPDLQADGFEFRRAQQLAVDSDALVQLAYLPVADGKPLAVCVLHRQQANELDLTLGESIGIRYAYWQRGQHAVAVVGHGSEADFARLAERVHRAGVIL